MSGIAYRLYQAAFDRTPGSTELGYWIGVMDQGASLREVSAGFAGSAECKTAYGADSANAMFVEKLYQNMLNRAGEPAGVAYWLDILNTGKETVAGVLASFSESAENQAVVAELIGSGLAYTPTPEPEGAQAGTAAASSLPASSSTNAWILREPRRLAW